MADKAIRGFVLGVLIMFFVIPKTHPFLWHVFLPLLLSGIIGAFVAIYISLKRDISMVWYFLRLFALKPMLVDIVNRKLVELYLEIEVSERDIESFENNGLNGCKDLNSGGKNFIEIHKDKIDELRIAIRVRGWVTNVSTGRIFCIS